MNALDVTILLPTYQRHQDLRRNLTYMQQHFDLSQLTLIVLDSSSPDVASRNQRLCEEMGIAYASPGGPEVHSFDKWLYGLEMVKTQYVCFLADDDLLNPHGFLEALAFLKTHPDYAAAHGRYIYFRHEEEQNRFRVEPFYNTWMKSIEDDDPLVRLIRLFANYADDFYAIHRTAYLTDIIRDVVDQIDRSGNPFMEFTISAVSALKGKIKLLDSFYMARQGIVPTMGYPRMFYDRFIFTHEFIDQYDKFKACVVKHMQFTGKPQDDLHALVDYAYGGFLSRMWLIPKRLEVRGLRVIDPTSGKKSLTGILGNTMADICDRFAERVRYYSYSLACRHPWLGNLAHILMCSQQRYSSITSFLKVWEKTGHGVYPLPTGASQHEDCAGLARKKYIKL